MVTTTSSRMVSLAWLLALFFLTGLNSHAASITAKTDRMNITIDEAFNISFIAEGDVDKAPDFSPLKKDFDILSQSQGSNISIINGDYKKTTSYTLTLMAKRAGNLIIPAIAFGKDASQPLAVSVGAGTTTPGQQADLILEVTPSRNTTWVQGQILLTVKLMSAVNLRQYEISKIDTGKFDASIEALGEARQYQTTQGNRNYLVIEQKFALYPQQSGKLTIEPLLGEVEALVQSRSYFDPFNTRSKILRARSRAVTINITDIPAEFTGKNWLPATDVQLIEEWSPNPPVFRVGEPVTRTLNLFADGLTAAQLPSLTGADIDGMKQYPDQPVLNNDKNTGGIIGGRREKIALIPARAGRFTLPAIEISWWNTKTGAVEVARIAEQTIEVLPGNATAAAGITPNVTLPAAVQADAETGPATPSGPAPQSYIWLAGFLATGWLLTGVAWWYSARQPARRPADTRTQKYQTSLSRSDIKRACAANQASACKAALISWARQALSPAINNLGDIIAILQQQNNPALVTELEKLNAALYSATATNWQGQDLWQLLQTLEPTGQKPAAAVASLEPLYK